MVQNNYSRYFPSMEGFVICNKCDKFWTTTGYELDLFHSLSRNTSNIHICTGSVLYCNTAVLVDFSVLAISVKIHSLLCSDVRPC